MTVGSPYGWDLSCVTDLDPSATEVGGNVILGQSCARRLITARGTLVDDANYGFDIRQFIDNDLTTSQIGRLQSEIEQELLKDDRVSSITSVAVFQASGIMTVTVLIEAAAGPFALVLTVTQLAATITVSPS